jgi:hypothetical protein
MTAQRKGNEHEISLLMRNHTDIVADSCTVSLNPQGFTHVRTMRRHTERSLKWGRRRRQGTQEGHL